MNMLHRFGLAILLAILATSMSPTQARLRAEVQRPCTMGDARAMFEALPIPVHVMRPRGIEGPKLLDSLSRCQYRLFWDGSTVTFSEADVFLGGIVLLYDYKTLGVTRAEAISDLESTQERACRPASI